MLHAIFAETLRKGMLKSIYLAGFFSELARETLQKLKRMPPEGLRRDGISIPPPKTPRRGVSILQCPDVELYRSFLSPFYSCPGAAGTESAS